MLSAIKRFVIESRLPDWRRIGELDEGYTVLLPSPMDIPFMLRLGLEGLDRIDTSGCRQILVVPDGHADDGGAGLEAVVADFSDPRIELVTLTDKELRLIRSMRVSGATTHWMQMVNGTKRVGCEHAFLHDSDAFFVDTDGLESQYREALERGMHTLGVTPRWDPFFRDNGFEIPGTWELMYSVRWARGHKPYEHRGRWLQTPHGRNLFDSMLYPQYLDYASGKVGVMQHPPELVHFNGTICTYRAYRECDGKPCDDDLFRLLLLSLLEAALLTDHSKAVMPPPDALAAGLVSDDAPVRYRSEVARQGYGEFRQMIEQLCDSPVFCGDRGHAIRNAIAPFDDHFGFDPTVDYAPAIAEGDTRVHSLNRDTIPAEGAS